MKYTSFHEQRFRSSVAKALQQVQTILDTTRHPRLAEDESHTYDDKYALVEFLTNTAIAAEMNALERLGLTPEQLQTVSEWVHNDKQTVTLRFEAEDSCSFLKEQVADLPSGHAVEATTTTGFFGSSSKTETQKVQVKTQILEYHWKVNVGYKLFVFCGGDPNDETKSMELQSRNTSTILVTSGGAGSRTAKPPTPIPERSVHPPIDLNLTWFFQRISPTEQSCDFSIDRNSDTAKSTCKTPRRNADVDAAVEFNECMSTWARQTLEFFVNRVETDILAKHDPVHKSSSSLEPTVLLTPGTQCTLAGLQKEPTFNGKLVRILEYDEGRDLYRVEAVEADSGLPPTLIIKPSNLEASGPLPSGSGPALTTLSADGIFCPIVPLMEEGAVLSGDVGDFLAQQNGTIDAATETLSRQYPPRQLVKLVSIAEATIVLMCHHLEDLSLQYQDGVGYVEDMLKQQLVQAIGKHISSKDFDQFISFHNQKLFGPQYAPKPFSYAIRRPNHYPDGVLSIEGTNRNDPVETTVRTIEGAVTPSIFMPINAATSVEITGDRHLHGWLLSRFASKPRPQYNLIARARQFSSFLVVVGTMASATKFSPKEAIILQNKDEVLIPLLTNVLPTAKEFKDAISSLSPDQQDFARTFRAMQLESSVFGVCVIQLKPQLEKLLELPPGSLTKEIQLTQDLMSLFVDYQIPSDLLSFDGPAGSDVGSKVAAVKGCVANVMAVIDSEKEKQLVEAERKADMALEMHAMQHPAAFGAAASTGPPMYRLADESAESAAVVMEGLGSGSGHSRSVSSARSRRSLAKMPPSAPMATHEQPMSLRSESIQPGQAPSKGAADSSTAVTDGEDFTMIPKLLDVKLEKYDTSNALKSTIIKAGPNWTRRRQDNLLTPIKSSSLSPSETSTETKKAFDLLDAISRSGTLAIDCAELHVVVAVSHCFDNDLMGTIIQDNINPIEKVERSSLLLGSTIHAAPATAMIGDTQERERLAGSFPLLFSSTESS